MQFKYLLEEEININDVKQLFMNNTKPLLIVGIGTPKVLLDSVGPHIATQLQIRGFKVRGTLRRPVHALNIRKFMKSINLNDYLVVAIDASIGDNLGSITILKGAIHPGAAAGKVLPSIGDISIKLTVATNDDIITKTPEAVNAVLNEDPHNLLDMFSNKIISMFRQLKKQDII